MKAFLFLPLIYGMSYFVLLREADMCQGGTLLEAFMKPIASALNQKGDIELNIDDSFDVVSANRGAFVSSSQTVGTKTDPISIQRLSNCYLRRRGQTRALGVKKASAVHGGRGVNGVESSAGSRTSEVNLSALN